jgi:hypothetical protein
MLICNVNIFSSLAFWKTFATIDHHVTFTDTRDILPAHTQPPALAFTPASIKDTRSRKVSHAQILLHISNVLCWYTTLRHFIIFHSPGMKISAFHWTFPKRSPRPRGGGKRGRNALVSKRASGLKAARGAGGEGSRSFLRLPLGVATTLMQQRLRQEQKQVKKN